MKKNKTMPANTVAIDYLDRAFTKDELLEIEDTLSNGKLKLIAHSHPPKHIGGIDVLFPQIALLLSPDIVYAICMGLATNGIYDAIKYLVKYVHNKVRVKTITRIHNGEIQQNATPNVHLNAGNIRIILPMDLEDEKFKYCVDKIFESLKPEIIKQKTYLIYNERDNDFKHYTENQIVEQFYLEWKQKQPKEDQQEDETTI